MFMCAVNRLKICVVHVSKLSCEIRLNNTRMIMSSLSCNENDNICLLNNLFRKAVQAVQPAELINKQIKVTDRHLSVNNRTFPSPKAYYAVGFGKAVLGMALALDRALESRLKRAIVIVPKGIFETYPESLRDNSKIEFIEGAENNIPDVEAENGAIRIKGLVESLGEADLLFVLISGGGSALLPLPKPPITLKEKQDIIRGLSRGGASIQELNTVRKQLSVLKGGGLAQLAYPAKVVSLILSDVVGNPLDIIASGPTVYYDERPEHAVEILKKYCLYSNIPNSVKEVLNYSSKSIQVDAPYISNGEFIHVHNFLIGTNRIATAAAKDFADQIGWQCIVMSHQVEGDVNQIAETYAQLASYIINKKKSKVSDLLQGLQFKLEEGAIQEALRLDCYKKILLIFAGEPTVHVTGTGQGGRNQQLALAFSLQLNKQTAPPTANPGNISLLCAGTDGIDGPTDAAGAIGYSGLVAGCFQLGLDPEAYLTNNDCYSFFKVFRNGRCLVKVGHTGTNVMDLHFLLIEPKHTQNI